MTRFHKSMLLALACVTASASAAEIYVSPRGNDGAKGTRTAPLATLLAAQMAARLKPDEPVTVYLEEGTYYLQAPIVLSGDDSRSPDAPLTFSAMPGKTPVVSGGIRVSLSWAPHRDGIVKATLADGLAFDQLFIDGQRQHMARWPNYDATAQYFQGFSAQCTSPSRVASWGDPAGGFVHAMHRSLWGDMHWRITGKENGDQLKLVGGWQNNRQMGAHKQYRFVENILEELDAANEWYLDQKNKTLYFKPTAEMDLESAKIEVVRLRQLIEFRGDVQTPVRNIHFVGLTFTHTARTFMENKEPLLRSDWTTYRGGAILFDGAVACSVKNCVVDQVGGNGIFVNNFNRQIEIAHCHIAGAGASGISFVGDPKALRSPLFEYHQTQTLEEMDHTPGPKSENYPAECLVDDCLIYLNGRVEKQTAGVNICMAESITIRNCSIYDCPRAGINICDGAFGGHLIEFCDVFDTVKETGDHGSFNSWGRDRFWHKDRKQTAEWVKQFPDMPTWDCGKTTVIRNNRWRCDHGWDIDLDDGSSNYEIYNNVCLAGGIKLREGYDRRVYNNIMVNYTFCPHVWYPDCRTSFQRNIIWLEKYAPAGMKRTDQGSEINFNLVHEPGAMPRPAKQLQEFGGDQESVVADALFVNPLVGDYRVQRDSPALALGFENFAMDRFGVRSPELRAIAKTPPLPGTVEAARIESGGWGRRYQNPKTANWLGAKLKDIETDGEMSAVGLGDKNGLLVVTVRKNSRTKTAGLRENDVILAVENTAISNLKEFAVALGQKDQTKEMNILIWRDQAKATLKVPAE